MRPSSSPNADADFRYRPHSDVWWLTGWPQPDVVVLVRGGDEPVTMFVQPRDPEAETWVGRRPGPEGAVSRYGADHAFPIDALDAELPRLLQGVSRLHWDWGIHADLDRRLRTAIGKAARASRRNGAPVPEQFASHSLLLHDLRLFKSDDELACLREAARLTADGHRAVMAAGRAGVGEWRLEGLLDGTYRQRGGDGPGYTHIVAAGDNACILHYHENDDVLQPGELVLVDSGCEVGFYTADVTRTFPVDGRFEGAGRAVYEAVLAAQDAAIAAAVPGARFLDVHDAAVAVLTEAMVALGLLQGDVAELIETDAYKRFYMHGTSHWLGLDVHDVGAYARDGGSRVLEPGMVLTVEPGLYIPPDAADVPEALRGIGVRIEDDVLITPDGHDVLTSAAPKRIDDVEAACRA
jgi:Xaa-Pro aminopeptidase